MAAGGLVGALMVMGLVYQPVLEAPFVYEDRQTVDAQPRWTMPGRAVTVATTSTDPMRAHLGNVALHGLIGALVFLIAERLAGPWVGLVAAAMVWLHPVMSEAVSYVGGRSDLLVTLGALLAVWGVLDRSGLVLVIGISLAALSHESGLVVVPLAAMSAWWVGRRRLARGLVFTGAVAGLVALPALWGWWSMSAGTGGSSFSWLTHLGYQLGGLAWIGSLAVWPVGFSIDHDVIALSGFWRLAGLVGLLAAGFGIWRLWPSVVGWSLAWGLVAISPKLLVPTNEFLAERDLYLAWVGLAIGASAVLTPKETVCGS